MSCKHINQQSQGALMRTQRGLVLFFSLLALLVMSLAAIALIRSVDTNNLVSGNAVFRQSANTTSNVALEVVTKQIAQSVSLTNSVNHYPTMGYYANCLQFDTTPANQICDGSKLTSLTWSDANSMLVPSQTDGNSEIVNGVDKQGNQIRYIVERMCNYTDAEIAAGTAASDSSRCMMAASSSDGSGCSHNGGFKERFKQCTVSVDAPLYRVTLRIAGPKNTVSFMQTFISN